MRVRIQLFTCLLISLTAIASYAQDGRKTVILCEDCQLVQSAKPAIQVKMTDCKKRDILYIIDGEVYNGTIKTVLEKDSLEKPKREVLSYEQPQEKMASVQQLKLYPNPVSDVVHLEGMNAGSSTMRAVIYNAAGQLVYNMEERATGMFRFSFPLAGLPAGMYVLAVSNGAERTTLQFIKE